MNDTLTLDAARRHAAERELNSYDLEAVYDWRVEGDTWTRRFVVHTIPKQKKVFTVRFTTGTADIAATDF